MPLGAYGKEIINLNIDSLWRGGPFEDQVSLTVLCQRVSSVQKIDA